MTITCPACSYPPKFAHPVTTGNFLCYGCHRLVNIETQTVVREPDPPKPVPPMPLSLGDKVRALHARHGEVVQVKVPKKVLFWTLWSSLGWLSITLRDRSILCLLTSHRNAHYPLKAGGPAYALSLDAKTGKILRAFVTALSLWPAQGEDEKQAIGRVSQAIEAAYERL